MDELAAALVDAGGVAAPREYRGRLRALLAAELRRGAAELTETRSGYGAPLTVAFAPGDGALVAALPVDPALRADPDAATERGWLLTAAAVGALVDAGAAADPEAGAWESALALRAHGAEDADLAALAFDDHAAGIDRLRVRALAVPAHVLADAGDLRPPIGATHPLLVATHVARLGGRPADPRSIQEYEEAVLAQLDADRGVTRPHDDPDAARRVARRILQRLAGMGKWGGYHTEFAHLARGFAGNDRRLAEEVGEALLDAGLLAEKQSVGQRHVFLNPRHAADIYALIERGDVPAALHLPRG